jgi:uncharacterized protein YgiM (DUF1202 family)
MELSSGHLKLNEIRCPYCRNKQIGVLPYYEELGVEKVNGVNFLTEEKEHSYPLSYQKCEYLTENPGYQKETMEDDVKNPTFLKCYYYGTPITGIQGFTETKCYCYHHKRVMIRKVKKELQEKAMKEKEEAKQQKLEEKEKAKQQKKEEREKAKQQKLQEKEKVKQEKLEEQSKKKGIKEKNPSIELGIEEENIVISSCSTLSLGCIQLLKTGAMKGNSCNHKIFQDQLCKRHYQNKIKINK